MHGYNASTDIPPDIFVRALYDYEADDPTSLSFRQGDKIRVLTQLESGWWDGFLEGTRGWFPSNYCVQIDPDDPDNLHGQDESETSETSGTEDDYDDEDDSDVQTQDDDSDLHIDATHHLSQDEAGFWIPQATPDGRLFYFNTRTGVSSMELPLESPALGRNGRPDSVNFHIPAQTRPPPEMMAGGYHHEEDYDAPSSNFATEPSGNVARPESEVVSSYISTTLAPNGTSSTSFPVPINGHASRPVIPRHFADETVLSPPSWETLVDNMREAIDAYRAAVHRGQRSEYVRRAEDISDHLRMILAAGSGTTDNHSGNPSIISQNKALYPSFREMMSKFSKLVISSHIAAADWPGPESGTKCLQEAEGVMNGVYSYVDIAQQQIGNELPRLVPGFVAGSSIGGNWQDNNIDMQFIADGNAFADRSNSNGRSKPSTPLDKLSLRKVEEARLALLTSIRRLEDELIYTEKIITPERQTQIGDEICTSASAVMEQFRPWIALVESIDLKPVGNVFQKPSLIDFASHKQRVYDSVGELVDVCQATTAPLPDEWSEVRGETMETRLASVRAVCKQLDNHVSQVNYSLQLLEPGSNLNRSESSSKRQNRMTAPSETLQHNAQRMNQIERPRLADLPHPASHQPGQPSKERLPIFGHVAPTLNEENDAAHDSDDTPWFLRMDHENEVHRDSKSNPPQVKNGTLAGLVEQLTRHDRPDTTFNATFLLTYRSFISAAELFQMLVQRFNLQPPARLDREEMLQWEEQKQKPVRFRVVNVLKTWIEQYWMESIDPESQQLLERMNAFARNTVTNAKIPGGAPLATVIEQRLKGQDTSAKKLVLTLTGNLPTPIVPKNMKKIKFTDIDPLEFARQLTIVESRLYGRIKPVECLEKIWEKKDNDDTTGRAPNIRALILHSNQVTNCVAAMILSHNEVRKRVAVMKHFVAIADVSMP